MILQKYHLKLQIRDKILGGIPKREDVMLGWLRGQGSPSPVAREIADKVKDEIDPSVDEEADKAWTTFKGHAEVRGEEPKGFYVESRQIKAMLKDAARHSELTKVVPGAISKIAHGLEIRGQNSKFFDRIYLGEKIDGAEQRMVHAMTPQGPRTSLHKSDYISAPVLAFDVLVGERALTAKDLLRNLFEHAEVFEGLGASVSQGYGKFNMLEFEKTFEANPEDIPQAAPKKTKKTKAS